MKDSSVQSDRMQLTDPDPSFMTRETRLQTIRSQALQRGRIEGSGLRPGGSPIPIASVETGYYGVPLFKEPQWSWEIPVYFFVGGAAGAAAVIAQFAHMTGAEAKLVRNARTVAAIGSIITPALLVSDLGVPSRFLNMLRVFKVQSPMSVGVYIVSAFGPSAAFAKIANLLRGDHDGGIFQVIESTSGLFSALFGLGMATYTGVLIGATAIPVWNENIDSLPIHFALSGLASAASLIQVMGHEDSRALNMIGIASAVGETIEGVKLETTVNPANEPLKRGLSGFITRMGGALSGPLPLALRVAAAFACERRSRQLVRTAAAATLAGSFLTRLGWIRAGHASARDYRLPLEIASGSKDALQLNGRPGRVEISDSRFGSR